MILGIDTFLCMTMIYEVNKLLFHFVRPSVGMMDVFVEGSKWSIPRLIFTNHLSGGKFVAQMDGQAADRVGMGSRRHSLVPLCSQRKSWDRYI